DIGATQNEVHERGATCTILVEIIRKKGLQLTPDEATIILLGIFEDTGRFTFTSTKPEDFYAAAYLVSIGANLNTVSDFMNTELSVEQVSLLNELIENVEQYTINGITLSVSLASREEYIGDLANLVHKMKDIQGLNVLIVLVRMGDRIHLVARSRIESVDVSLVASEFGGGGHPTAASANIHDLTLPQTKERLISFLKNSLTPQKTARDIMVSHAKVVSNGETISNADKTLTQYSINSLPVVCGKTPVGIVTRQILKKAISHNLGHSPVDEFMIRDFATLSEDSSYMEVDEIVIGRNQKLVPVIDKDGNLTGIISRGEVLRTIYGEMMKKPGYLNQAGRDVRYTFTKSMTKLLKERLTQDLADLLKTVAQAADEVGLNVNLVGGFVRDLFLRIDNTDIDIVVEGDGIAFSQHFANKVEGRVRSHSKFGTAVVVLPDGKKVDVASTRIEYYERPAALPMVEMSSQKHDLFRRDFTINSLSIRLNGSEAGKLVDYFGGQRDLKERVINVMHNLSFVDDPTRVFRAIRFEQRFNFSLGKQTLSLLKSAVRRDLFHHLSGARLFVELVTMLKEKEPVRMVRRMNALGLLRFIHPKLTFTKQGEELFLGISEAASWYHLLYLGNDPEVWFIYLLGLIDSLNDSEVDEFFQSLNVPEKYVKRLRAARADVFSSLATLSAEKNMSRGRIYEILNGVAVETLLFLTAKAGKEWIKKDVSLFITHLNYVKTELTGADLIDLGLKKGPEVGRALVMIKEAKLNGIIRSKADERAFIKEKYGLSLKCNT
ncbi:MAG: CBS domain-containing protein, partial [Nitrospinota bacterium]